MYSTYYQAEFRKTNNLNQNIGINVIINIVALDMSGRCISIPKVILRQQDNFKPSYTVTEVLFTEHHRLK